MKQKLVSGLGILLVLPAFAGARLPAVNTAKTAVSARAQYGAPVPVVAKNVTAQPVAVESTTRTATNKKRVVARTAKSKPAPSKNISVDTGEKIAANNEYLIPNRPSPDLWAKNDTPLRMPRANEFSVITSNDALPEEYIATAPIENEVAKLSAKTSSLDAQIARLMEMQKRADESIKSHRVSTSRPEEKIAYTAESAVLPESVTKPNITNTDDGVHIARVVVPRDDLIGGDVVRRAVKKDNDTKIKEVREDMTKMSPAELRRAFRKTFLSENKHLSTYPIDDRFDVASDIGTFAEGFTSARDLSEDAEKIRPLEIKIGFKNSDSALSRENYNLLSEYAGIVVANPKRAIQVAIPVGATQTADARKLAARRLAIVEQVLRDTGVSEQRIVPVLSQRDEEGFVLRIISNEQFETLTKQKRNMFGDTVGSKTYKSMSW
ncbi:MAG: hypothetical protein J5620_02720 [Alphaproteobacteria bacterium]|nr:hypothetical protein [Alphaproteobacteria bacterium]